MAKWVAEVRSARRDAQFAEGMHERTQIAGTDAGFLAPFVPEARQAATARSGKGRLESASRSRRPAIDIALILPQ
jgi:hypothetical protein